MNAPMITVADYSNGSEGYTYNYFVCQISSNNFSFSPALFSLERVKSNLRCVIATIHRKTLHLRKL